MSGVIIAYALIALTLTGASYYIVVPYFFNIKAFAATMTTDPKYIAFGEVIYRIIGIYPLLHLGAIFLNAYQQSIRQSNQEAGF